MNTQVLAQSATQLSVSTPKIVDIGELVRRSATRNARGNTLETMNFNRSRVFSQVCNDYRSLMGIPKVDANGAPARVSEEVAALINQEIDNLQRVAIDRVSKLFAENGVYRSAYCHQKKERSFAVKHTLTAVEGLDLKAQRVAAMCMIRTARERLARLQEKYADPETIEKAEKALDSLVADKAHVICEARRQDKLAAEANKAA